jgi:hypothetical protein
MNVLAVQPLTAYLSPKIATDKTKEIFEILKELTNELRRSN